MTRFLYASYVADDLDAAVAGLEKMGMPCGWRGEHGLFRVPAALCESRQGGMLVLQGDDDPATHPAIRQFSGERERMFHLALGDLPSGWEHSSRLRGLTGPYDGPLGPTLGFELMLEGDRSLWLEATAGDVAVGNPASTMARVESTPMAAERIQVLEDAFASLRLVPVAELSDTNFPTLGCDSHIMVLDGWHFLELNEPTGRGVIGDLFAASGRCGLFGVSIEAVDLADWVQNARAAGLQTNTTEPIVLPVVVDGVEYAADDIITVPPYETGGARIFVITARDYPWALMQQRQIVATN